MKWLRLKYWWRWNIAWQRPANGVFLALSPHRPAPSLPLLAAFPGSAKCSEPGPHPVHTQARGAGERVRHSDVSRSGRRLHRRTSPSEKTRGSFWGLGIGGGCHSRVSRSLNGGGGVKRKEKVPYFTHVHFFFIFQQHSSFMRHLSPTRNTTL